MTDLMVICLPYMAFGICDLHDSEQDVGWTGVQFGIPWSWWEMFYICLFVSTDEKFAFENCV